MKNAHDLVAAAKAHVQEISLSESESAIQAADVVLDVREPDEYHAGHIAGALNIPRGLLEFKMSGAPELGSRDLNILVYCKSGGRAALAAQTLQEMGYLSVSSIAGGFDAWSAAGKPVAKPELPPFE